MQHYKPCYEGKKYWIKLDQRDICLKIIYFLCRTRLSVGDALHREKILKPAHIYINICIEFCRIQSITLRGICLPVVRFVNIDKSG